MISLRDLVSHRVSESRDHASHSVLGLLDAGVYFVPEKVGLFCGDLADYLSKH